MSSTDWLHEWATERGRTIHAETEEEALRGDKTPKKEVTPRTKNKSNVTPAQARTIYDRRYRTKNRFELNRREREYSRTPKGAYAKARKKARERKQEWTFSFKTWWQVWTSAGEFEDPDRPGITRPAWELRGSNPFKDCMMTRVDTSEGWSPCNVEIKQAPQDYERH
jgi:hypothetical protein